MAGALIGALRVSLSAETSAFEAGMKRSQRTAQTTASKIKSSFGSIGGELNLLKAGIAGFVGALSVGTIIAAGKAALDYAGSLGETAQALGVTTRELQTFRYAVSQNGGAVSDADQALGKLAINMSKAQAGSKQAAAAFGAVGVSLADIQTKSREEILGQIADKMKATGGAANNAAAGVAIFGRGFLKIAPTLDQGSAGLNNLADAAERLGIVLSDEQIRKADETADKLDALQTVLKAQIAGVVADNADAILDLANAIAQVAAEAGRAIGKIRAFYDEARIAANQAEIFLSKRIDNGILGQLGIGNQTRAKNRAAAQADTDAIRKRQADERFSALFRGRPKGARAGGNISQFLASGGGGGRSRRSSGGGRDRSAEEAERKRLDALRDANQFDQEIRRAKIDVLQATRDLATDAVERYQISIQIKDAEKAAFESQLQYEVAAGERTQAQADALQLEHDRVDQLERDKLVAEEQARAREESNRFDQLAFDLERDRLQSESQLAETASEQRDVQLRLLDLAYRQERARLQAVLADEQSSDAAKEEARQRLANLNKTYGNDRESVMQGTRGPLEDYLSTLPSSAAKVNEALEGIAANGLKAIEDGLVDVIMGAKSFGEAFKQIANQIIADLIRIAIQQLIVKALMSAFGGGFSGGGEVGGGAIGMATGGFVSGPGGPTADRVPAMLSAGEFVINAKATRKFLPLLERINGDGAMHLATGGLALPRTSMAERARISNDNDGAFGPAMKFEFHNDYRGADPSAVAAIRARQDQMEQRLPGQIVATVQDAKKRFVLR